MVTALADLVHVAHLADEDLGGVGLLAHRDGDLGVVEDGLVDHAHLVPVQPPDHLVVHHAGVDAGLDLQAAVEGLAPRHRLHRDQEVEVEPRHVTGHHGQLGQTLAIQLGKTIAVQKHARNLVPDDFQSIDNKTQYFRLRLYDSDLNTLSAF